MKRKIVLSVAFLLALVLTLSVMPFASAATKAQNGLQFELTTDKEAYTTGESIQCELTVANSNDQELNITYEVILPEGLTLAATQRGVLQVAVGGKVTSDFAVQTEAKGADELPSTGDNFPLEVVAVLMVLSAVGCAVFFKKTRFVAFMLLCVMLIGVVEPALVNSAVAETRLTTADTKMTYPEDAYQVEYTDELSEEAFEIQLAEKELQVLDNLEDDFVPSAELGQFELSHNVVLDNQLVTIKVVGAISSADVVEESADVKALGTVSLNPITILGKTKFKLTWSRVPGATHYEVWHRGGTTGNYIKRATTTATTWTTNYGTASVINTYKVRAITKSGNTITAKGPYATRTAYGMDKPTISSVAHVSSSSEDVRIKWNAPSYCTGYMVYRSFTGASGTYSRIGETAYSTAPSFVDKYRNGYYKIRPYYTGANGIMYMGPASELKNMPTQYRALIIGQTYPNHTASPLPGCKQDAQAMLNMLYYTSGPQYRTADTDGWLNIPYANFQTRIKTAFQRAKANDVSLIYYSGHGSSDGSWCTVESNGSVKTVTPNTLRTWLDEIPGKKIVISDSCHSGRLIGKGDSDVTFVSKEMVENANSAFIQAFAGAKERANLAASNYYVISACRGSQTSTEVGFTNGVSGGLFTIMMLNGSGYDELELAEISSLYADNNGDNDLTLSEVYNYTVDSVEYFINSVGWQNEVAQDAQVYPSSTSTQLMWGR